MCLLFCVAGLVSYRDAKHQALSAALTRLDRYNDEVVQEQEYRFKRIVAAHAHATELLVGELKGRGLLQTRARSMRSILNKQTAAGGQSMGCSTAPALRSAMCEGLVPLSVRSPRPKTGEG